MSDPRLEQALQALKNSGHDVGAAHIAPPQYGGTMRIWIDSVSCTFENVLRIAEEEKRTGRKIHPASGKYFRLKMAPNTRMGTIEGTRIERGRIQYLFRHDARFYDPLPDSYVFEDEVELCDKPTDEEVARINKIAKPGS